MLNVETPTKRDVGSAILNAFSAYVKQVARSESTQKVPVILVGHDRGARITHRLLVDRARYPDLDIIGATLMDIVPTMEQWRAFADPAAAKGYFHWPFLANVDLATQMIMSFGGGKWCRASIMGLASQDQECLERLRSGGALERYAAYFEREGTVRASCKDYTAGAGEDVEAQRQDQEAGRKISVPILVMYSKKGLGGLFEMGSAWENWVDEGVSIESRGIGNEAGHFFAEERPEEVVGYLSAWIEKLWKDSSRTV